MPRLGGSGECLEYVNTALSAHTDIHCLTHLTARGQAQLPSQAEDVDDGDERTGPVVSLGEDAGLSAGVTRGEAGGEDIVSGSGIYLIHFTR